MGGRELTFGFRDAGHYYYRLFAWNQHEREANRIPLWNPLENTGTPQLADGSSSVFYPLKEIFSLTFLDYEDRLNLYIVAHVAWAALGIGVLARRFKLGAWGQLVACIAYPFSGIVLTQTSNVVFLVGAAWLPWGLAEIDRANKQPLRAAVQLGFVLAMLVLGGDPQMAFHLGLIGCLSAWLRSRQDVGGSIRNSASETSSPTFASKLSSIGRRLLPLASAFGIAAVLSAVQWIPSSAWSRQSERAVYERPRSVYEAAEFSRQVVSAEQVRDVEPEQLPYELGQGLLGEPVPNTHHDHIYQFSVPPWTTPELMLPNFSGKLFPTHQRWMQTWIAGDRIWNPTLYMGAFTILLALVGFGWRAKSGRRRFISRLAVLSLLTSFGWYGVGWILRELAWVTLGSSPNQLQLGSPTGGLYWLLVTFVPLYSQFRYPAKWLVITACCIALLAGYAIPTRRGIPTLRRSRRFKRLVVTASSITLIAWGAMWLFQSPIKSWLQEQPPSPLFGPLQVEQSWFGMQLAFLHASVSILVGTLLIWCASRQQAKRWSFLWKSLLVVGLGLDLWCSHTWVLGLTPRRAWESVERSVEQTETAEVELAAAREDEQPPLRYYRMNSYGWLPSSFAEMSDPNRMAQMIAWDTATLFPKHNLAVQQAAVDSYGSLVTADYAAFLAAARWQSQGSANNSPTDVPLAVLRMLGTEHVYASRADWPSETYVKRDEFNINGNLAWRYHLDYVFPRAWLVQQVELLEPPRAMTHDELWRASFETVYKDDQLRDFTTQATVEVQSSSIDEELLGRLKSLVPLEQDKTDGDAADDRIATVRPQQIVEVLSYEPQKLILRASAESTSLVVLTEYYQPGWRAEIQAINEQGELEQAPSSVPILRTNRVFRGVLIPAGDWQITLNYQPSEFRVGRMISSVGWLILLGYVCVVPVLWWRRQRQEQTKNSIAADAKLRSGN